jgi:hypothetical protein
MANSSAAQLQCVHPYALGYSVDTWRRFADPFGCNITPLMVGRQHPFSLVAASEIAAVLQARSSSLKDSHLLIRARRGTERRIESNLRDAHSPVLPEVTVCGGTAPDPALRSVLEDGPVELSLLLSFSNMPFLRQGIARSQVVANLELLLLDVEPVSVTAILN